MTATILQSDGNRTDPARFRLDLDGEAFAQGSSVSMTFSLLQEEGLVIQNFEITAVVPFAFPCWDFFEYLYFLFDRQYQNWALGKVLQKEDDIRLDIYPRVDAEFSRLTEVALDATYVPLSEVDEVEFLVLIEKAALSNRWVYSPTDVITTFRVTVEGDQRITTNDDLRVAIFTDGGEAVAFG